MRILGWYSLIIILLAAAIGCINMFKEKDASKVKIHLLSVLVHIPIIVYLYITLFR